MRLVIAALVFFSSFYSFSMTGLEVGQKVPELSLKDTKGEKVDFNNNPKTIVAIFFRGSWCPYCVKQLKTVEDDLVKKVGENVEIVAISVDKLSVAKKMKNQFKFSFQVISDPLAKSLKAFKIINKLDDSLVQKYKASYKIDVEGDSGQTHHMVAHPAVFIIKNGKIAYADIHVNYKERTKNSEILKKLQLVK